MGRHQMGGEDGLVLHKQLTDSALPGTRAVGRLVGFPALVIHRGQVAEVARVAVSQRPRICGLREKKRCN